MAISSYDYLMPLVRAHQDGRWGLPRRDVLEVNYYLALEILGREQDLPLRLVKLTAPCYHKIHAGVKKAVIPAIVLFQGTQPVLCDVYGNQTPEGLIGEFNQGDMWIHITDEMKSLSSWSDRPWRQSRSPYVRSRLADIVDSGRVLLHAFHLQSIPQPQGVSARPIRRI